MNEIKSVLIAAMVLGSLTAVGQPNYSEPTRTAPKFSAALRAKAKTGDARAQFDLGVCYALGRGVPPDQAEARKWLRQAAEQNDALARYDLEVRYDRDRRLPLDDAEAAKWFRQAAVRIDPLTTGRLDAGQPVGLYVPTSRDDAVKRYRQAAERNYANAQFALGVAGPPWPGVLKREDKGVEWFRQAAERNDPEGQYYLGFCYAHGLDVPQDYVEAYKWLSLAGTQGSKAARRNLTQLEKLMSREQIAEGQRRASEFRPK